MPDNQTKSPLGGVVRGALLLLVAAAAVHVAVRLIQAVWVWLVVIAGVLAVVAILLAWWHRRNQRW